MRALRYDGPYELSVVEVPIPEPRPDEVLLRVVATGICGSDVHGYMGKTGRRTPGMIMGHEIAATVVGLGPETAGHLDEGQPVSVNPFIACGQCRLCHRDRANLCERRRMIGVDHDIVGGFSEYLVAPARNVFPLSREIPIELGALVEPFAVSYRSVLIGGPVNDQPVLVIGGGPIGLAALVAARRLDASLVILSEPIAHRRAAATRLGALAVDPTSTDLADFVRETTDGHGIELALDCVGSSGTVAAALVATLPSATVVLIGLDRPTLELPLYDLITQERRLVGSFGYTPENFAAVVDWVNEAPTELLTFIEGRETFDGIVDRFQALARGVDHAVKVLLVPHAS